MPIKFTCPHCQKALSVRDQLAGKKGTCPACKKVVTVPAGAAGTPSNGPAVPTLPTPVDVEAAAAAAFADEPAAAPVAPTTVDFTCPHCDAEIHVEAELAGKKTPCPECRRIIRVPELKKAEKKDWRKARATGPSGARPSDQPAPEGAWGTPDVRRVSAEAMAAVLPEARPPLTRAQKITRGVTAVAALTVVVVLGVLVWGWLERSKQQQALKHALDYAATDEARKQAGREGLAALHTLAGDFYRGGKPPAVLKAREQYEKAFSLLNVAAGEERSEEREAALAELAAAQAELGGSPQEVEKETALKWDDAQRAVQASLSAMSPGDLRLDALRTVSRRFIARDQADRLLPLTTKVYASAEGEKAAALAAVGLELLAAEEKRAAEKAANQALEVYATGAGKPTLMPEVVALALALNKDAPDPGKGDEKNDWLGKVEGLARQGKTDAAREKLGKTTDVQFQLKGYVVLAAATEGKADVEAAIKFLEDNGLRQRPELSAWLFRLVNVGVRAGADSERLEAAAAAINERALRGRAQLAVLRSKLKGTKGVADEKLTNAVDAKSVAHRVAWAELARHNARADGGYNKVVQKWEEPARAFGSVGFALGLQGD
jgi:hypothetical protein